MNVHTHNVRLRAALTACTVVSAALLLTACGSDKGTQVNAAGQTPTATPTYTSTASPTDTASPTSTATRLTDDQAERQALIPATKVTWDKAATTATGEVSGSKLVQLELQRHEGGSTASPAPSPNSPEWEATVATQDGTTHTVLVDAITGDVVQSSVEPDQDADDKREVADRLGKAKWTAQQAVKAATDKKQGVVTTVELDDEDAGQLVWSVDVVTEQDWSKTTYDVDAASGKILSESVDKD
ncbi:PepSY domain-containing protein [Streptomyces sp. NPDC096176]|uniref:PepSY domain-containing protein n=1 Tax=Streptomyces sp. NPDC096176 TaxID=3366079 RepID=UPI0037FF13EB